MAKTRLKFLSHNLILWSADVVGYVNDVCDGDMTRRVDALLLINDLEDTMKSLRQELYELDQY